MVHRCCISSCGMSVRVLEAKGLSYHKFPTKETIRDQRVQAIIPHLDKPESFKVVPRYTRVCSRHFRKKDYCIDAKKRARLTSNAVPSVFPRKNTPLVIPTVLPASPKMMNANAKPQTSTDTVPGTSLFNCKNNQKTAGSSAPSANVSTPNESSSSIQQTSISGNQLDELLGRRELVIESVTIQDDHLILTVTDPASQTELESVSISDDQYQDQSISIKSDEAEASGGTKRRKRRKWNRTAFARPAKGKRKLLSVMSEPSLNDDANDNLSDLASLGNANHRGSIDTKQDTLTTSVDESYSSATDNDCMPNVTLLLSDLPNQPYQLASVEQELLQSIQAVSLRCVGDPEDVDTNELHDTSPDEVYSYTNMVPAFLHHHSSEESLFSNESQNVSGGLGESQLQAVSQSDLVTEDDSLRFELVDLRIDPDMPSAQPPSYLDIDELAHQLNSSLFTDGKISLFTMDSLNLNSDSTPDLNLNDPLMMTPEKSSKEETVKPGPSKKVFKPCIRKSTSQKMKGTSGKEIIPPKKKKLKGVSKRPKKDKIVGKFSVERFKNSDKDIEYYTGFNSYRNFEAFFRFLEAYIEKICITDVTYGVNNLPTNSDLNAGGSTANATTDAGASSSTQRPVELPKKRPCQGRSMSRINELFMTIIRLRRKLPEKVLGHMFFISQPTVSRVVRAWTVLLSKIIDSYPVESSMSSSSAYKEHSYTSKGLGIPDSFRDLFYSDLAKSIVITSLNPKKMKSKASTSQCTRNKKSKSSPAPAAKPKEDCAKSNQSKEEKLISIHDFLLDTVENPVPVEQLHLFDFI